MYKNICKKCGRIDGKHFACCDKTPKNMKLLTLAKRLDFTTETDYFDYCINSWFNGNFSQCKELFAAMTKADKKGLIDYIKGCYDYTHDVEKYYFNLL